MTALLTERPRAASGAEDLLLDEDAWHHTVSRYARPSLWRTAFSLLTSVVPFIGCWALMYFALDVSYLLTLALALPTAGFLLRTYILFHDCAHGSLLPWPRANAWLGSALALISFTPFNRWRHEHLHHHATAGNLDRRGVGDVPTLTVAEYQAQPLGARFWYRFFRNPFVMFGIGPVWAMLAMPRFADKTARPAIKRSVWRTNLAIIVSLGLLCWLLGWKEFLLVEAPLVPLAGGAGIWLFLVQHQFDETYWERSEDWNYADAALRGSSYLKLPKVLQFFTGNIGFHHVHHLNPKIPNYNLPRAHDDTPVFARVPKVSLWRGLRAVRLKLWDEGGDRLVSWADIRNGRVVPATVPVGSSPPPRVR